jgi:hypothetical protein
MKQKNLINSGKSESPALSSLVGRGLVILALMTFISCEYKEIAGADYPDNKLYLPAAVTGIYKIENLSKENPATPTPGSTYRYVINKEANTFEIPLAIYRSGLNRDKTFTVRIAANTDTVQALINAGTLEETAIIPSSAYRLDETVVMAGGSSILPFTLSLNLDYIKSRVEEDRRKKGNPSTYFSMKYATGVSISTGNPEMINPDLSTVIVSLDIKIFSPEASFEYAIDGTDPKLVTFLNYSEFSLAYLWDFGDGKTSSEASPKHTYAAVGAYAVTLKATGLLDDEVSYTKTVEIK